MNIWASDDVRDYHHQYTNILRVEATQPNGTARQPVYVSSSPGYVRNTVRMKSAATTAEINASVRYRWKNGNGNDDLVGSSEVNFTTTITRRSALLRIRDVELNTCEIAQIRCAPQDLLSEDRMKFCESIISEG